MGKSDSSFATRQLEKYGWKAGEGLGKRKHGICAPIRASMKFSRRGLGCAYTPAPEEAFWSNVYETAISQIVSVESSGLVNDQREASASSDLHRTDSIDNTLRQLTSSETSSPTKTVMKIPKVNFQRQSVLNGGIETPLPDVNTPPAPPLPRTNSAGDISGASEEVVKQAPEKEPISQESKSSKSLYKQSLFSLSESSLLKLGAGRTGHPAARFGMRCGGKLSRAAKFL
nr:unnamed protein product [Spirometra erinaceieuropaei]